MLVSALFRWPFSAGDATFLFICLPGLSLLVPGLFRWPCSISVHLPPRSVTTFVSLVSVLVSVLMSPRFGACNAGVRPFRWPRSISIHSPNR